MKALALLGLVLCVTPLAGDQVVDPPLNASTIVGTWEALSEGHPATLWHMQINKKGDSYLAQITVGTPCVVRRLIASDIKDGVVKLHFAKGSAKEMPDPVFSELRMIGTGEGTESRGGIDAMFCGDKWPDTRPPRAKVFGLPEKDHMFFIKGTWTRDLSETSKVAEKAIKKQISK